MTCILCGSLPLPPQQSTDLFCPSIWCSIRPCWRRPCDTLSPSLWAATLLPILPFSGRVPRPQTHGGWLSFQLLHTQLWTAAVLPWRPRADETSGSPAVNWKPLWDLHLQRTVIRIFHALKRLVHNSQQAWWFEKKGGCVGHLEGEIQIRWGSLYQRNHRSLPVDISQQYIHSLNHWHAHSRIKLHLFQRGLCFGGGQCAWSLTLYWLTWLQPGRLGLQNFASAAGWSRRALISLRGVVLQWLSTRHGDMH